jgi:putative ABC transport system substrate-binding protein
MERRIFIGVLSGGLLAAPLAAEAQPSAKVARIGFLTTGSLGSFETQMDIDAFRQGLRGHGYVERQNIVIEYRAAERQFERLPGLATELTPLKLDLIVAAATPAARAAQRATTTIPIVAIAMGDPVGDGLVASLARPGGNLTGTTFLGPKLVPKHLELLKEALPRIALVPILWHPNAFAESTMRDLLREAEAAARTLRIQLRFVELRDSDELEAALSRIIREHPDALVVFPSVLLFAERWRIVAFALKHRLSSMVNNR